MAAYRSEITRIDRSLHDRVSAYCRTHEKQFEREINVNVRRYFLKSLSCYVVAILVGLSGILIAWKTGHRIMTMAHLPSFLYLVAFSWLSTRWDFFNRRAVAYFSVYLFILCVESIWVFRVYQDIGKIHVISTDAPLALALGIWTLNFFHKPLHKLLSAGITLAVLVGGIAWISWDYMKINMISVLMGTAIGVILNVLIINLYRYKFFFSQQEKMLRTHAYRQLEKMVYPHQRRMIELGRDLEETMPVGWGEACVLSFDIVESSKIEASAARELFQFVLKKCHRLMMEGYSQEHYEAKAYRIKEMGDGFLCSVGYPFQVPGQKPREQLAIELARDFVRVFQEESARLLPGKKVHCAVGIASGVIESFYAHTYPKEFDLFGRALILATRYEAARRHIFQSIDHCDLIILQEQVYQGLNPKLQAEFESWPLKDFKIRDDEEAQMLYLQRLGAHDKQSFKKSS